MVKLIDHDQSLATYPRKQKFIVVAEYYKFDYQIIREIYRGMAFLVEDHSGIVVK